MINFKKDKDNISAKLKQLNKLSFKYSVIRMIVFLSVVVAYFAGYNLAYSYYILMIGLVVVFLVLLKKHDKIIDKIKFYQAMNDVIDKYEINQQYLKLDSYYEVDMGSVEQDLDIFNKNSLFERLNTCQTKLGHDLFKSWLSQDYQTSLDELSKKHEAINELYLNYQFILKFNASLKFLKKDSHYQKLEIEIKKDNILINLIKFILPVFNITLLVLAINQMIIVEWFYLTFFIQVAMIGYSFKKYYPVFDQMTKAYRNMESFDRLIYLIEQTHFTSLYLQQKKAKLSKDSFQTLKQLDTIMGLVHARNNALVYIIVNGLFLWDFHVYDMLVGWLNKNQSQIDYWQEIISEFEAIISLISLNIIREDLCIPEFNEDNILEFKQLRHPLLGTNSIANDLKDFSQPIVITGSNMSGKTTFLRSIGVNYMLAKAGSYVVAKEFKTTHFHLLTSIRVSDDLDNGISSFYAELLRIKTMIEALDTNKPLLLLIDEIFKGTNSADRIFGAKQVIKQLNQPQVKLMVSTHDFELCDLKEENTEVLNYHFGEYYEKDEIKFDYLLKPDRCQTTNAQFLMKVVGINLNDKTN